VTKEVQAVADMCCGGRVVSVLEGGYGCHDKPTNYAKPGNFGHSARTAAAASSSSSSSSASSTGSTGASSYGASSYGEPAFDGGASTAAGSASASSRESLNRRHLVDAACAHVRALVDPYGHAKPEL
jgi:predicted lipid-binding transport protein (Tim44 family)